MNLLLLSMIFGVRELACDQFIVRLTLEGHGQADDLDGAVAEGGAEASSKIEGGTSDAGVLPAAHVMKMSIGGYPFQCMLPMTSARRKKSTVRATRYIAAARSAALTGQCLRGRIDGTEEAFELCLSDQFSARGLSAQHEKRSDEPLGTGGFVQLYAGISSNGEAIVAQVRCECGLAGRAPREPPCRLGDSVEVPWGSDGQLVAAVVTGDTPEGLLTVRVVSGAPGGNRTTVHRSLARTLRDGTCDGSSPEPPKDPAVPRVMTATVGDAPAPNEPWMYNVTLGAPPCCNMRSLRSAPLRDGEVAGPDLEYHRLLAPLAGRCMRVLYGWWTYELCWPWRVRQFHSGVNGEVDTVGTVLGNFASNTPMARRQTTSRYDYGKYELVASLEGDACEKTAQTWSLSLAHATLSEGLAVAVGAAFNPPSCGRTGGTLIRVDSNLDGCKDYDTRLEGAVVLVKRGRCWFHTKALKAESAGASAVIVCNDQRQMIDVMEGVDELPSPHIPAMLVEEDLGERLRSAVGSYIALVKTNTDGIDLKRPVSTSVTFGCRSDWHERQRVCEPGEQVEVKLGPKADTTAEPRWPRSSTHMLKAIVTEVFDHNGSILVSWSPQALNEGNGELPTVVPMNQTYLHGVPCSADMRGYIEGVAEPQACQSEFFVHVAALCSHPHFMPPQPRENQVISCLADEATRQALTAPPSGPPREWA